MAAEINNTCPKCGRVYRNWCTHCKAVEEQEGLPEIMEAYGLTADTLVAELALHIAKGHFAALSLALGMKGLGPIKRIEHAGEVKHSFGDLLREAEKEEE